MCSSWNNLWSVCPYIMWPAVAIQAGWEGQTVPIWKCLPGIDDHRFTFLVELLPDYTFYANLTILYIGSLLIEDVTSLIYILHSEKLRKVCRIVWCWLNISWQYVNVCHHMFVTLLNTVNTIMIIHSKLIWNICKNNVRKWKLLWLQPSIHIFIIINSLRPSQ